MSEAKEEVVLDTNVVRVSNGEASQASQGCVDNCNETLTRIRESQRLLVDDRWLILDEYTGIPRNLSGQPGLGDFFVKWIWDNKDNERHCRKVKVTPNAERGFDEFPDDSSLAKFDMDDRKFVAVAIASGSAPKILNASDTDWRDYRQELGRHGVEIEFICPELMRARTSSP